MATTSQTKATPAQRQAVWAEFQKFGYTPSSEGEIDYWAVKPIGQLFSALQKRKDADPKKQLNNDQLYKLYDEFGLAPRLRTQVDYDWARKNLPNDVTALKSVLKSEQTKQLAAQKAAGTATAKPAVTPQPPVNNQNSAPTSNPTTNLTASGVTGQFSSPTGHLVKFTGDPNGAAEGDASTLWYVDPKQNIMRPIMSMTAFNDLFNNDPATIDAAKKSINTVDVKSVQPGGSYSNFFLLGADYGIYDKAQAKPLDFSPNVVSQRYGKPVSMNQVKAAGDLDNLLNYWENSDSGLDKASIEKIKNDPTYVAGLVGALAYGNYSFTDIWQEVKRKQAADSGDATAQGTKIIDAGMTREKYLATDAGKQAATKYPVPDTIAGMDSTMLSQPLVNMPDDFYKTLYSGSNFDPTSPEYKAKAEAVKSEMHDLILNQLSASTEGAKMAADREYEKWRVETEKKLGISLDQNSMTAWKQLESTLDQGSQAGISGSGIENENVDKSLAETRRADQYNREATQTAEADKEEERLKKTASPAEIQKMNEEDAAKGLPRNQWRSVLYQLAPVEPMTKEKFLADYHSKYPTSKLTDAQILDSQYNQFYDANGNYRSELYQKSEDARQTAMYGGTVAERTAKAGSYTDYQNSQVTAQNDEAYKNATKTWDPETTENVFGSYGDLNATGPAESAATGIQENLGVSGTTAPAASAFTPKPGTSYIPNVAAMANFTNIYKDPNSNKLYGTPKSTVTTGTKTAAQVKSTYTPPAGYEAIAGPSQIKNYQPNTTISKNGTLYGIKLSTPTSTTKTTATVKPVSSTPTGTTAPKITTPAVTTPKPAASSFTIKPGTSYIPNVASMGNYTNIYKDPNSSKLYGTLKK